MCRSSAAIQIVDKQGHSLRRFQWATLGIVLLTIAIRLPSLPHPPPIDSEGIYSVVANEIVDGGRPYLDAVERKPPLLFWTYAVVFELAGKYNWKVLHIVALVWTLATMAGFFIELGPGNVLAGLPQRISEGVKVISVGNAESVRKSADQVRTAN